MPRHDLSHNLSPAPACTDVHDHDHRLAHDLDALMRQAAGRRQMLGRLMVGVIAPMPLLGCGGGGSAITSTGTSTTATSTTTTTTGSTTTGTATGTSTTTTGSTATTGTTGTTTTTGSTTTTSTSCSTIPEETGGPYPADGTNTSSGSTSNVLTLSGIVRSNIVSSIGASSGSAVGVPLTITLKVVNTSASCANLSGFAVYLWHCDQQGRYSLYSSGVTGENYLRGVQVTDSSGSVTFTSIYPACYDGRWPHIHFEVYASTASATTGRNAIKTSQIAMPASANSAVFATSNYTASAANYAKVSLATDGVFSDGASLETPSITGSVSAGYAIALQVGVTA